MRPDTALKRSLWLAILALAASPHLAAGEKGGPDRSTEAAVVAVEVAADGRVHAAPPVFGGAAAQAAQRVLVKFRPGQAGRLGPEVASERALANRPDLFVVTLRPGHSVADAVRAYRSRPDVLYAEPDYLVRIEATPSDPRWAEQWGPPVIRAPEAWDTQTDAGDVVVAVIDTGVDFMHPDLAGNLWTDPVTGGHGFTFEDGVVTEDGSDVHGHGTHVAGVIGAVANNGVGIAGLNWSVQILSLGFIGANGLGNVSDAVLAFDKIVELRQAGYNIRLSNNSWSVGGHSQALEDAMAQATAAGVLHVCAAGNGGNNIDTRPNYPAGLDGTGILTVNASNQTDGHATFSGYGLALVDLAAPGDSILSTVPTGTCALCDPSGYRLLSGTSMATPHVAGVLAAAFHLNPALQPEEARAVVLDPGSFALLNQNSLVSWNTTGGRLDFAATLANPALFSPPANAPPTAAASGALTRSAGSDLTLSMAIGDADGDPLRAKWSRAVSSGLLGFMMNTAFPTSLPSPYTLAAPSLVRNVTTEYAGSVADGRGGSALVSSRVNVLATSSPGLPPTAQLTVTPTEGPVGTTIELSYAGADPDGGNVRWAWGGYGGACCFPPSSTATTTLNAAGVYRVHAQAIDEELLLSPSSTVVVRIGGALGEPPLTLVDVDTTEGTVPLTVNFDATASYDPDGGSLSFSVFCDLQSGYNVGVPTPPTGSCTYDEPGVHELMISIQDDSGYGHSQKVYIMATVPISSDQVPPSATLTAPAAGTMVGNVVTLTADASDDVGVERVDFLLDGTKFLGSDGSAPFSADWDARTSTPGGHTLTALAFDQAGNEALSAPVAITVDDVKPEVSVTAPPNGALVGGLVTVAADATDNFAVDRVEFLLDGAVLIGSDDTAPFAIEWDAGSVSAGSHHLNAKAYDELGNQAISWAVNVTVDPVPPTVSLTAPAAGAVVGGLVTLSADATDDVGLDRVEFLLDGSVVLGSDATSPFSIQWDASGTADGGHTLEARAVDQAGNQALSGQVAITVDNVAPTATVTAPAAGASVSGTVTVSADATDDVALDRVEFLLDGSVVLGSDATAPYSIDWDTVSTPPGPHDLQARAIDAAGNEGLSGAVAITVLDVTPPAPPAGLTATGGPEQIALDWADSPEGDLAGYRLYRSTTEGGGYAQIGGNLAASSYLDAAVTAGTPYYYVVTAFDASGNESGPSAEATAAADHVNLATADFATPAGTVSGSFVSTHAQDDSAQGLEEVLSGGKPSNRYSYAEHVWQFDVMAGDAYSFHVDAHRTASPDGDEFRFEYSTDGSAYATMLTVTKVADDDVYQVFSFPLDVAGTLYVRAVDTNRTSGNQALDTLSVDHMLVATTATTGPDTTPPNPPTGLTATPGDGQVSLDWADSGAPDLAGYRVYRSTTAGGPHSLLTASLLASSAYVDAAVVNGTTYYYVVTAEDLSGNESAFSQEVSATPQAGGSTLHVESIVLSAVGGRKVKARAVVTVLDDAGLPVAGATVTGTFGGDYSETLSGSTDSNGVATLTTSSRVNSPVSFTFCVDDVSHASLAYDPAANVETCDQLN